MSVDSVVSLREVTRLLVRLNPAAVVLLTSEISPVTETTFAARAIEVTDTSEREELWATVRNSRLFVVRVVSLTDAAKLLARVRPAVVVLLVSATLVALLIILFSVATEVAEASVQEAVNVMVDGAV
jgi:hypothetical protein